MVKCWVRSRCRRPYTRGWYLRVSGYTGLKKWRYNYSGKMMCRINESGMASVGWSLQLNLLSTDVTKFRDRSYDGDFLHENLGWTKYHDVDEFWWRWISNFWLIHILYITWYQYQYVYEYQILESSSAIHKFVMTKWRAAMNLFIPTDGYRVGRAAMNLFISTDGYRVGRRRRSDVEGCSRYTRHWLDRYFVGPARALFKILRRISWSFLTRPKFVPLTKSVFTLQSTHIWTARPTQFE
jgi:hypothetical protein